MPKIARRTVLFSCAALLVFAGVFSNRRPAPPPAPADTLPEQLSNAEFWNLVTEFSEPNGYFRSDNFLSNEAGYQYVIPELKRVVRPKGVYLGVGPEQNFTYIVGLEPKMAFIVDIRRGNMLEHLLYKAFIELSADRAELVSRLFARPRPEGVDVDVDVDELFDAIRVSEPSKSLFDENLRTAFEHLENVHGFGLSAEDEEGIRYVYSAFFESGPQLSYSFRNAGGFRGMPTYSDLMSETDGDGKNWNFLANDAQFRFIQRMEKSNLIVPLVGDFAGRKALRSVGKYLTEHHAILTTFYTSNVEQYLFQQGDDWRRFYENVSSMPLDSSSAFIRYVINGFGFGGFTRRSRSLWEPIADAVQEFNRGRLRSYYAVIDMSN